MQITLEIPDEFAAQAIPAGQDPRRAALEALAVDGYRANRLTEAEVRQMLDFDTRMQVHSLLAEHGVPLRYTAEHLQQDLDASSDLRPARTR